MTLPLRIFRGATELNYTAAKITRRADSIVDTAIIEIEAEGTVGSADTIDFKKSDGSTVVFSGKIREIKKEDVWTIKVLSNGWELHNIRVEQVYENQSPEAIVQDVVDNHTTNLTYVSGPSSGVTLTKYIAKAYGVDVIKDMMDVLDWQLTIDENDNVKFEPKGNVDNGVLLQNGASVQINSWEEDQHQLFNHVKLIGGFENFGTQETATQSIATHALTHKPNGDVRVVVTVGGASVEISPDQFNVDADNKQIIFTSATKPVFEYSYNRPIIIDMQDDDSIADLGTEVFKELPAPFIDNDSDARRFAQKFLDAFSRPVPKVKAFEFNLKFERSPGEIVRVIDTIRNQDKQLVITKLVYDVRKGITEYELGTRDFMIFDWEREVQDRIKKLERRFQNDDQIVFARTFKHNLKATLNITNNFGKRSMNDSFVLSNQTLGRFRSGFDFEADCSDNANHGTWTGAGVTDGNQYDFVGFRLSTGVFGGTNHVVTVSDSATLQLNEDMTLAVAVKVASLPGATKYIFHKWDETNGYGIRINQDDKLEFFYEDSGTLTNLAASTGLSVDTFQHFVGVKTGATLEVFIDGTSDAVLTSQPTTIGTSNANLEVGKQSTNFFTGRIDEVRVYSSAISATQVNNIFSKQEELSNLNLWLSMDNPHLGDRRGPTVSIETGNFTEKVLFNSTTDEDTAGTADWDTSTGRLRMSDSSSHMTVYNTIGITKTLNASSTITSATLSATEVKFGADQILYFLTANGGDNWESATRTANHTFANPGRDLRARVAFFGNGGRDTYISTLDLEVQP